MTSLGGFTDLPSGIAQPLPTCTECGSITRIARGICAGCLMRVSLADVGEFSRETFENVLAEADVSDGEWRLGQYEILGEIGRGGMGVIYRARQRHSRRIVALKRVLSYQAESYETLARFRREAEAAASLDHPNILPIYEVAETEEGIPYFSMKLATGGSVRAAGALLRKDTAACVRLMAKVARAVAFAHEHGILHRDLQPGNILLDSRGEPMVSDFGLAKWLHDNSDLTRTLTTFGTPGFIAPEQADGKQSALTPASDIYSLGAILFSLLVGRPPFIGPNALSVVRQAAEVPAPRLRTMLPGANRDLETITERCLAREPSARYASAAALAEDLERWGEGRPILARPILPPARLLRWVRRNPALAAVATGCVGLALVVLVLLRTGPGTAQPVLTPEKSIAVLPFENLSQNGANDFFTEGMHEDILTDLGKLSDLRVISRSSVREYLPGQPRDLRRIGRDLGVRYVLEGSIQRAGERVRVSARLSDSQTGAQIWADQYDRDLSDLFTIQDAIAGQIVDQLQAQLSPGEAESWVGRPTIDIEAYDLYLRARESSYQAGYSSGERFETQARLLNEAIEREPHFVAALCLLARVHVRSYWENFDHTPARLEAAWRALELAARIDPGAGDVHLTRAIILYWGGRNYEPARQELLMARRLLPNDADVPYFLGLIARRQGDWFASTQYFEEARGIDPRNELILFDLARANYIALKRYAEAARIAESAVAWRPDSFHRHLLRARIDVMSSADVGRWRDVLWGALAKSAEPDLLALERVQYALAVRDYKMAELALATHALPRFRWDGYVTPFGWYAGLAAAGRGDRERARAYWEEASAEVKKAIEQRPEDAKLHVVLGEILARLGDREGAMRAGERAVTLRPVAHDAVDGPFLLARFAAICAQVGETGRALDLLEQALPLPYGLNYGPLQLEDCWDPLRKEPRFQKILAELAPKTPPP